MFPFSYLSKLIAPTKTTKKARRQPRSKQVGRRLALESLESRNMTAVDVTLNSEGMLRITGDEQHNYVDVYEEAGQLLVYTHRNRLDPTSEGPQIRAFDLSKAKSIYFDGMAGDDYFVDRVALPTVAYGGEGDDYLLGGKGRNQLYGEAGNDTTGLYDQPLIITSINKTLRGPQDQSPIAVYYRQYTDFTTGQSATSILGQPTNDGQEYASADGKAKMRTYENGVIVWTEKHGASLIYGEVLKKWDSLGGFNNQTVGNPITSTLTAAENQAIKVQLFEQGLIMARADKGTFEMHGEIYKRHTNLTDREQARLGWITSDEQPTADGRGRVSYFSYGRITWDAATNKTSVIYNVLQSQVSPSKSLNDRLLFIMTSTAPARLGGMTMSSTTNNFYTSLGRENGVLGPQVAAERFIGSKMMFVTEFKYGAIYRTMTATFEVHGDIYKKYMQLGGPIGPLGLPKSNELAVGDAAGGRFSHFEFGSNYWTAAKGAFEVRGDIQKAWNSLGNTRSSFGYPTSDEHDVSVNSEFRISNFQNGAIVYSMRTGTILLQGAVWQQWKTLGPRRASLGHPPLQYKTSR